MTTRLWLALSALFYPLFFASCGGVIGNIEQYVYCGDCETFRSRTEADAQMKFGFIIAVSDTFANNRFKFKISTKTANHKVNIRYSLIDSDEKCIVSMNMASLDSLPLVTNALADKATKSEAKTAFKQTVIAYYDSVSTAAGGNTGTSRSWRIWLFDPILWPCY